MSKNLILSKLEGVKERFEEVGRLLNEPGVMSDMKNYIHLNKEYKELDPVVASYKEYKNTLINIDSTKDLLAVEKDDEMREMAKAELDDLTRKVVDMEENLKILLLPTDPQDEKNAILEIRAGSGGDEASIFAGDLFRLYSKFCEQKGWKMEITNFTDGTAGGYKEIIVDVSGDGVYGILKYESGVHRVQRVPQTYTYIRRFCCCTSRSRRI
jgi:peptide chain release factor 1